MTTKRQTYKGYEFSVNALGYSVYKGEECVAAGGAFFNTNENRALAKRAIMALITGTRKPINAPQAKTI